MARSAQPSLSGSAQDIDELDPTSGNDDDGEDDAPRRMPIPITPPISSAVPQVPSSSPVPGRQIYELTEHERILAFHLAKGKKKVPKGYVRLAVHHIGSWYDWRYDEFEMTMDKMNRMVNNFTGRVLHRNASLDRQVPLQIGHGFLEEPPAVGWMTELEIEDDILWGTFKLNKKGQESLENDEYSFVSPRYSEQYEEQEIVNDTRTIHHDVLIHVALTNQPVLAELPQIALSKTPTSLDVGVFHPREAQMSQPQGDPTPAGQPAAEPPAPAPAPANPEPAPAPTSLAQPPVQPTPQPAAVAQPPADGVMLTQEQFAQFQQLQETVRSLSGAVETERLRSHTLTVDGIIREAASRGVPPAITNIVRPIMLAANPAAQKTINLAVENGEDRSLNTFEAMQELLTQSPTVALGQQTRSEGGASPAAKSLTLDEAEAEGRKMWASAGIIPQPAAKSKE